VDIGTEVTAIYGAAPGGKPNREDLKRFWQLDDAIEYVTDNASEHPPSEVLVHQFDGLIQVIATFG
jgi:hypothetical protein